MEKKELLYEGKAKKVYTTENPDVLIVDYKDDATAFNGVKKGTIVGKGVVNNRMTNHIFRMLEEKGIPTHYIEELSDRETAVKKVEIVPLEVIVRNVAAGSFSKKLGIENNIHKTLAYIIFVIYSRPVNNGLSVEKKLPILIYYPFIDFTPTGFPSRTEETLI